MSNHLSKKVKLKTIRALTGWDAAIFDAERSIDAAKVRIETLTVSIHRFKQFKEDGEPFPGENPKRINRKTGKRLSGQPRDL